MQKESISLQYREGSSDKVYHANLEESGSGWVVSFTFGRRGFTLQSGTKTNQPVPYDKAKKIFDKIVAEKMSKGYTTAASGTPYVGTDKAGKVSGLLPQLLNVIDDLTLELCLNNNIHCAQEKFDGRRTMVRKASSVDGVNKKGILTPLPLPIQNALESYEGQFVIDGEAIGDTLYVFDLLEEDGDIRALPYRERYTRLMNLVARNPVTAGAIILVETAWTPKEKRQLLEQLKKNQKEGIVFKEVDAPAKVGRPNIGGTQLKSKFYSTASVIVKTVNDKRSVAVSVLDDSARPVAIGNVTIPANQPIPKVGDILEVRYLYAFKGGSLYQPTCLGIRTDVDAEECVISQLKYKASSDDDEEG
jgi:bifunctional non-homologous end joining protein LigD